MDKKESAIIQWSSNFIEWFLSISVGIVISNFLLFLLIISIKEGAITVFFFCILVLVYTICHFAAYPRRIKISSDVISISLLWKLLSITKSEIRQMRKWKSFYGTFLLFKKNKPINTKNIFSHIPVFIPHEFKPFHKHGNKQAENIVEAIENWFFGNH